VLDWLHARHGESDPLFLQFKEAQESVLATYLKGAPSFPNQGFRVVLWTAFDPGIPGRSSGVGLTQQDAFSMFGSFAI